MDKIVIKELKKFSDLIKKNNNIFEGVDLNLDNFSQAQLVCFIGDNKDREVNQKDIEKALCLSKSSVSSLLDTLENKNVIKREISKVDARKNIIKLSDEMVENIMKVEDNILKINNKITKNIDKEKINTFFEVLELMNENIRKED